MFRFTVEGNLSLTIAGAFFCLIPLFAASTQSQYPSDDFSISDALLKRGTFLMSSLYVIIIPTADLLLDLPSHVISYFNPREKQIESTEISRLTDMERLLFLVGVLAQSAISFVPAETDLTSLSIVYGCTDNLSILLILSSIVIFLGRVTTTFSHYESFIIIALSVFGMFCRTIKYFYRQEALVHKILSFTGLIALALSGIAYVTLIMRCFYKYCCLKKLDCPSGRGAYVRGIVNSFKHNLSKGSTKDDELYTNHVPALHMLSSLVIASTNVVVTYLIPPSTAFLATQCKYYIILAAEILVLVIELRIRKNEIARGLVSGSLLFIIDYALVSHSSMRDTILYFI